MRRHTPARRCPVCRGKKKIVVKTGVRLFGRDYLSFKKCHRCKGLGYV
ncbi:MAG: hypothetical protein ACJ75S_02895 [Solirubrobacterales bacterium]